MIKRCALLAVMLLLPAAVHGETLRGAIIAAYASNPELAEARAREDARAEGIVQERARARPTLSADTGVGTIASASLRAALPLWTGGRIGAAVDAARADVAAGEQRVRDREAAVLEQVVRAYAAYLFARESIAVARIGIDRLDRQVDEARTRFDLGEASLTDVAQLRTQRASVMANLADAEGALDSAAAAYRAVVGQEPLDLETKVPPPAGLASTLADARAAAVAANPRLIEQLQIADAAAARIRLEQAAYAPSVDLAAGYGRAGQLVGSGAGTFYNGADVGVTLRLPILTGGLAASRVRAARATYRAERLGVEAADRAIMRDVDMAWAGLSAARKRQDASAAGLEAAKLALEGVRAEYGFGLRSTLDILNVDQGYRDAQLAVARSRSDMMVAQAALLRASGRLDRDSYL